MTVTEANAVNAVLRYYLMLDDGASLLTPKEKRDGALEGAEYLADRAHKVLGAGLRGADVRRGRR